MTISNRREARAKGKVTFVITSLYKDGAETQMVRVAVALTKRGWLTGIVTLMDHNDFQVPLAEAGIEVQTLGIPRGRYDPRSLPRLVKLLRAQKPDVVCTFMYHANVLGRVAARIAKVPVVVSSIRNAIFGGWIADRLTALTDKLATVTTTNSVLAAEALVSRGVVRAERLVVVPNAVDIALPSRSDLSRDALVGHGLDSIWLWLSVGRLERQKGHEVTIRAVAMLKERGVDSHLAIAGNGSLEKELQALREELHLEKNVTFLGYRNDVRDLMAVANGFVLASRWEGLPNVVMEACAAGLPVVATDVGGVREILEDGVTGVVVAPDDVGAMADGMASLVGLGTADIEKMADKARAYVKAKFASDAVMAAWESLFTGVIERFHRT